MSMLFKSAGKAAAMRTRCCRHQPSCWRRCLRPTPAIVRWPVRSRYAPHWPRPPTSADCNAIDPQSPLHDEAPPELHIPRLSTDKLLVSMLCEREGCNEGNGYWVINDHAPYQPVLVTNSGVDDDGRRIRARCRLRPARSVPRSTGSRCRRGSRRRQAGRRYAHGARVPCPASHRIEWR